MIKNSDRKVVHRRALTLALPVAISGIFLCSLRARASESPPAASRLEEELDEILVSGERPVRKPSEIITWMRRLVGQFSYEGHVDLRGQGDSADHLPVQGGSICVPFGPAPAVQCEVRVTWPERRGENGEPIPGGVSTLDPGMILYGFEPDELGIRYMLVDNRGFAEPALGLVVGDTLVSRGSCVNMPGNCERIARITAPPDLKMITMQIDIEVDYRKVLGYTFVMRRVTAPPVNVSEAP